MVNKKEEEEVKSQLQKIYRGGQNKTNLKSEFDEEKIKEDILKMSEISLWLDTYDDIFSDFDPRPYTQRSVSVDFLDEIKRASRDKASGQIELKFLAPGKQRNIETEIHIKRRLKDHFKRHYEMQKAEKNKIFKNGLLVAGAGFVLMFAAVLLHYFIGEKMLTIILTTLFQPAGWFMMFYGFDNAFYGVKEKQPEIDFYEKMSKAEISFISY